MKICTDCVYGIYLDCYYDYGGSDFFFFSDLSNLDKLKEICRADIITPFRYCPNCGNKNNISLLKKIKVKW